MRYAAIVLTLMATHVYGAEGSRDGMQQTFVLPPSARENADAVLEVRVGPLARGQRVRFTTAKGELIGAIAPFGAAARSSAGVYSLPVPRDAIRDGKLDTRVTIEEANKSSRAPTKTEVQSIKLRTLDAPPQ